MAELTGIGLRTASLPIILNSARIGDAGVAGPEDMGFVEGRFLLDDSTVAAVVELSLVIFEGPVAVLVLVMGVGH